ncbi:hypothetical protein BJ878DRAFT_546267 [Calycina marina]|uniref:Mitotic apparatus protein p62 n=1 Tax=Calycina marina TaxID=1763456 RepID=A0A9P8CAY7_9HELO|nr:hypothetical protein BJ878DRAFT_546267 [Calycina marina]
MPSINILRLPLVDGEDGFVLLKVTTGKRPLDLSLIGTEGDNVFAFSVKQKDILSLRADKFAGSLEDFEHVLAVVLLGGERTDELAEVEIVARISERKIEKRRKPFMNIAIQKRIEGITQKYGEVDLPETTEEELPLFDWVGLAIELKDGLSDEVRKLQTQLLVKEEEAAKLKAALEDLVKVKSAHEDELTEKFSLLLNEKKLKIRDQQRLLASSTVDPDKLAAVEAERAGSHSPGPSRARKRKAGAKDEGELEDGFEQMDVDEPGGTDLGGEERAEMPGQSTADEASEDEAPIRPARAKKIANRAKTPPVKQEQLSQPSDELPPRRKLPFNKKKATQKIAEKVEAAAEDSETESDNDEL